MNYRYLALALALSLLLVSCDSATVSCTCCTGTICIPKKLDSFSVLLCPSQSGTSDLCRAKYNNDCPSSGQDGTLNAECKSGAMSLAGGIGFATILFATLLSL